MAVWWLICTGFNLDYVVVFRHSDLFECWQIRQTRRITNQTSVFKTKCLDSLVLSTGLTNFFAIIENQATLALYGSCEFQLKAAGLFELGHRVPIAAYCNLLDCSCHQFFIHWRCVIPCLQSAWQDIPEIQTTISSKIAFCHSRCFLSGSTQVIIFRRKAVASRMFCERQNVFRDRADVMRRRCKKSRKRNTYWAHY